MYENAKLEENRLYKCKSERYKGEEGTYKRSLNEREAHSGDRKCITATQHRNVFV